MSLRLMSSRCVAPLLASFGALAITPGAFGALNSAVVGTALQVSSTANDAITISCVSLNVKINGADPGTGPAACSSITTITVTGGPMDNQIDLGPVGAGAFTGITGPVTISGGGGNDDLRDSGFVDTITGDAGDDVLRSQQADDGLDGGEGADSYDIIARPGFVTVTDTGAAPPPCAVPPCIFGPGIDSLQFFGGPGNDSGPFAKLALTDTQALQGGVARVGFTGIETPGLYGGDGNDELDASAATLSVQLVGGGDDDTLTGGSGADFLTGTMFQCTGACPPPPPAGIDSLLGGPGDDWLESTDRADTLDGQGGSDLYLVVFDSVAPFVLTRTVGDTGPGADQDSLKIEGTPGNDSGANTISVLDTTVVRNLETFSFTGIESTGVSGALGDDVVDASTATVGYELLGGGGQDQVVGGSGNDALTGDTWDCNGPCGGPPPPPPGNDTVAGGSGDDFLESAGGTDSLDGGEGSDEHRIVFGAAGLNASAGDTGAAGTDHLSVLGTSGPDTIVIGTGVIARGGESITVAGGIENRSIYGNDGNDVLDASTSNVAQELAGLGGDDTVTGGLGPESLFGDDPPCGGPCPPSVPGSDVLHGGGGADQLFGGDLNDTLDGGSGGDQFDGGNGIDTADYSAYGTPVTVTVGVGVGDDGAGGEGDTVLASTENVSGGTAGDTLTGDGGPNALFGNAGNDTLDGGLGNDVLDGGADIDTASYATRVVPVFVTLGGGGPDGQAGEADNVLTENVTGGAAGDMLMGDGGPNLLAGGMGNDQLDGAGGPDVIQGGPGAADVATYAARVNPVFVSIANGPNDGEAAEGDDVQAGVEHLVGGAAGDQLAGDGAMNFLYGGPGNDVLDGLAGDDTLYGEGGDDTLNGGANNDRLDGGPGADAMTGGPGVSDAVLYWTRVAQVTVMLGGSAGNGEAAENDSVDNTVEVAYGGFGNDVLTGDLGSNNLYGGPGNDTLVGNGGPDYLYGGTGDDVSLDGGAGQDFLMGELGADHLTPGSGADIVYGGPGNDEFLAPADGVLDWLYCGPDADFGNAEAMDRRFACEAVTI